jgi:hypothetical protein
MTPTLPLDFAPLRAEAERLAAEMCRILGRRATVGWWEEPRVHEEYDLLAVLTGLHARLLADLSRPESRDFWCRWLMEHDLDAPVEHRDGIFLWASPAGGGIYSVDRTDCERRRAIWLHEKWGAVRDDPEALRTAVLALGVDRG